jgi:hypothetical protein
MSANRFADPTSRAEWDIDGSGRMTDKQRKMLNACCGDLAAQVAWHGNRLSKDDWRHMIAGTMLGWRMMPAIDRGEGAAGFIMLGGSSLNLSKTQARDAITCALHIGDRPDEQSLKCKPVRWCDVVYRALGFDPKDMAA